MNLELIKTFSIDIFGITLEEAHNKQICIKCKKHMVDLIEDPLDVAEYNISGLCPGCWEALFK